ncbi:MAG: TonB-dependent receptor [Usitatibacter sp.]
MRTRRSCLLASAVLAALATSQAGYAQQAQKIEKIEVTGSNIKRVEGEGPSAIVVITREDIERSGATNAYELLNLVSANNSAGNVSIANTIGSLTFSANTASLRGLQGGRTLVLLNGKRLNGFAGEVQGVQGVNLTTIPFNAIERVEVLLDGASAIYGSDAIAGVINFIVRKDYHGAEITGYYATPTRGGPGPDGSQSTVKVAAGFGDLSKDRYNVFVAAQYDKQNALEQRARSFSNTVVRLDTGLLGISGNTFPGHITTGGIGTPSFPDCSPSTFFADAVAFLGTRCFYDPAAQVGVQMIPDVKTFNVFGSGTVQLTNKLQAYFNGNYSKQENHFVIQPAPISDQFTFGPNGEFSSAILLPPTSPFYPHALAAQAGVDGQPLNVRWRAVESGNRDTTDTNEQYQMVGGLKGSLGSWDWDASLTYNEGTTSQMLNGGFPLLGIATNHAVLIPLLNSGQVNFFGPNSAAVSQAIKDANYIGKSFDGKAKSTVFDGKVSGELWSMPAGPVALAVGMQASKEDFAQTPAPVLATGDLAGFGGNILPVSRDRDARAVFAEVNIPLLRTLEANLAVRHDHYSDFGNTTNPKYSLRFQPTRDLLLRTSYGTGFLAPSLYQLWTPNIQGVTATGLSDPARCPVTMNVGIDCSTQFGVLFGGNSGLRPEQSRQWSAGLVFEPARGLSFGVDWFDLYLKGAIVNGIGPATVLGDLAQFGSLVTRAAPDAQFPNLPGRIVTIDQRYINLGGTKIQGIDVNAQYSPAPTPIGRFRFSMNGSYYIKYDVQQINGTYAGFVSNTFGSPVTGVSPRWKSYQSVSLDNGPWTVVLGNTYQSSYTDAGCDLQNVTDDAACLAAAGGGRMRTVSSMSLWDVQVSWKGIKNLALTVGARNVLDTDPPQTNQANSFQAGFDPSYYDPRARLIYVQATYSFK